MNRIIKSESSEKGHSVKPVEYVPLNKGKTVFSSYSGAAQTTPVHRMSEVKRQMETLMGEARGKADNVIQKANADAVSIKERAFQSGYQSGWETAVKEIQMATDSIFRAFRKGLDDVAAIKDEILGQAENDVVQLSIAIAKKLVYREIKQNPDTITSIVREAVKLVKSREEIIIKLHPDDCEILRQHMSEVMAELSDSNAGLNQDVPVRLEEDSALTPGGCIVETDAGIIDMSFEARIESIDELVELQ